VALVFSEAAVKKEKTPLKASNRDIGEEDDDSPIKTAKRRSTGSR
jgi:hypothetical protein